LDVSPLDRKVGGLFNLENPAHFFTYELKARLLRKKINATEPLMIEIKTMQYQSNMKDCV
jgi:hypothetical protein